MTAVQHSPLAAASAGEAQPFHPRIAPRQLALAGTPLVFLGYAVTLGLAHQLSAYRAAIAGLANTIPTMVFGLVAYTLVVRQIVGRRPLIQIVGHALLAALFALLSYWLLVVMLGAAEGNSLVRFTVAPFSLRGSAFQMLQNVSIYGILASLAYVAQTAVPAPHATGDPADPAEPNLTRYFIRTGEEIRPIDVAGIVCIAGADDYAEVSTTTGRHLARMTLGEFERTLDPGKFVRVHRSHIVNVERIQRAEPAGGGRLLLHMETGEAIATSRTGARVLRDRLI